MPAPIRVRPLGHFLESGLLHLPQAALRRFPQRGGRWTSCVRWSGFAGKTFIQYHGVSYEIYISRPNEPPVHCRLFDGKLYCENFRFTLTSSDAARLTQCITELMETAE